MVKSVRNCFDSLNWYKGFKLKKSNMKTNNQNLIVLSVIESSFKANKNSNIIYKPCFPVHIYIYICIDVIIREIRFTIFV